MKPKIYVVGRAEIGAWSAQRFFVLTFDEASGLIHDLQDAMVNQRALEDQTGKEVFLLVNLSDN